MIEAQELKPNILVFTKTNAHRHNSIPTGINCLKNIAKNNKWNIIFSEDSLVFNKNNLQQYNVIVFLNTSGDIFDKNQKLALQSYISSGNGFVGIHAASNTEKKWPWFTKMIGATFKDHPRIQKAKLFIDKTHSHPAVNHLSKTEFFYDEWYNFLKPVDKDVTVLALLDEDSYEGKKMNTNYHPIIWFHHYEGGRVFYTGLGHTDEIYNDTRFIKMVKEAIIWASGIHPPKDKK